MSALGGCNSQGCHGYLLLSAAACSWLHWQAPPQGSSVNEFNPLVKKMWSIIFINIVSNVSHKHTHGKGTER